MNNSEQYEIDSSPGGSDKPMSLSEKLANIITAPTEVFLDVKDRIHWQHWAVPLLLAILFVGVSGIITAPYTLEISKKAIEAQQEKYMDRDMNQEQRENLEQRFEEQIQKQENRHSPPTIYYWSFARAAFGIGLSVIVLAALYLFAGNTILGGERKYVHMLVIVGLPQVVSAIESVYNSVYALVAQSAEAPSSLAVLLPYSASEVFSLERYQQALFTLLSQIDFFTIWRLILFTIGFKIFYDISRGKAIGVIFGYWVLWLIITTAGAFLFAGLA